MIRRGELYWADLGPTQGSRPAKRRPVLVVQSNSYNSSRLATVLGAVVTSNTALATMPGNVFLPAVSTGLPRDSVVNVTALVTLDEENLDGPVGVVAQDLMRQVAKGFAAFWRCSRPPQWTLYLRWRGVPALARTSLAVAGSSAASVPAAVQGPELVRQDSRAPFAATRRAWPSSVYRRTNDTSTCRPQSATNRTCRWHR